MRKFEELHPLISLIFFLGVLLPEMFLMDMYLSLLLLIEGLLYLWALNKKINIKNIVFGVICVCVMTVINMLVSHTGEHILFYINNRPITLEAARYGMVTGIMLSGVFFWFLCMDKVLNTEKVLTIFSHMPKLALIISMILRLIPRYLRKYNSMKKTWDINKKDEMSKEKMLGISSGVFTYALENSVESARVMEMRGFLKAKKQVVSAKFKIRDVIIGIILLTAIALFFIFVKQRIIIIATIGFIPFIYRGKEAIKLWIYKLRTK